VTLNQKLTRVIRGRSVVDVTTDATQSVVHFDDGSRMTVKLAGPPVAPNRRGTVTSVRQSGTSLDLDLGDGSTIAFTTPDPMASVMVRAADQSLEYAD
jgi:hypothetical protein